ncbi:myosin-binding protein 7-like [Cucurbita moschata]|uniref:Myosin-binding protein 7-like n=1 Tax=Cucurbita moschata TaxID=3662 RepID=A0A6J1F3X1_CUCMO|nr:myosin-binding protein 7-like [Cucurbita moschata]XP_022935206.1 myosin-binding protein 7-like [Cucurbita moschata]XP_022935207.1 myosin-binding protein 7-like [Cucurbita moschata]
MDSEAVPASLDSVKYCNCPCSCSLSTGPLATWIRSVKRKYDELDSNSPFTIVGLDNFSVIRVQVENECNALREMVNNQQQAIQDLYTELEEERNASSSAANEAMSMILRLQREKAEIQMEARQFKRFAEEKIAHDQQELASFEDLLYKREQAIQSLTCEVQAYKHRMMSYGLTEDEADGERGEQSCSQNIVEYEAQCETPMYDYPPLRCNLNEAQGPLDHDNDIADIEKYAFGETPRNRDHVMNLGNRISQLERSSSYNHPDAEFFGGTKNVLEKVIVGQSPRRPRHSSKFSNDSSFFTGMPQVNESPRHTSSLKKEHVSQSEDYSNLRKMDNASEVGDDTSDRVYTIDSIHNVATYNGSYESKPAVGIYEDYITTPRGSLNHVGFGDPEVKKLYLRLQALEADRESMRQALISMRTDKAQLVLLKEIAQHLYKGMSPERQVVVKKPSIPGSFSFMAVFKWIASFVFWRRKARRSKYLFGLSNGVGLLMLLEKGTHARQWRCLSSTQV